MPLSNSLLTHSLKLSPLCLTFSQNSLKLSPLCLTFSQNSLKLTLSNSHLSISLSLARLNPQCHHPPKLDVIDPLVDPLRKTPKQPISLKPMLPIRLKPMPLIHFSDALNSLKLLPLNSHLSVLLLSSSPIHASNLTRL